MKKIVLVPDSFKGTMSSQRICQIMSQELSAVWPDADIISIPAADGGEGSVDAFLCAMGGEKISVRCKGPCFEERNSFFGMLPGNTAVVEMAAAAGLPLVGENRHAEKTTTYGVGELILAAVRQGARKIILGLGGSATNDGGCGAAAALGVTFQTAEGRTYIPVGGTLERLAHIDTSGLSPDLRGIELAVMCDIDNPLCGSEGASAVFGPQKGAGPETVKMLDRGLARLADTAKADLGTDYRNVSGSGAAGGMGFGMMTFLGCRLERGIQTILNTVGFDKILENADCVLTGEGKMDWQSMRGKVVQGVAERANKKHVPVIAIVGDIGDGAEQAYQKGVSGIFSINRLAIPFSEAKDRCERDMRFTVRNLARFLREIKESPMP